MGASIVAVRIKGILHEFSTVPGVTEDVADIIFNLKEIRLRLNESEQQTLQDRCQRARESFMPKTSSRRRRSRS